MESRREGPGFGSEWTQSARAAGGGARLQIAGFAAVTSEACRPRHGRCVHELILEQIDRAPEAVAVVALDGKLLTYEEMGRRAHRLAHLLIELGVRPEVPVGLCLEPSPRMIIALLAILEAGGAYLPLDPSYPAGRLAVLLEEVGPPVVISEERWADRLPPSASREIWLDACEAELDRYPETSPEVWVVGENLAYVLYTSGSTGRPKGVAVCHRSLSRYLSWVEEVLLSGVDLLPWTTSLTFDACLKQIFAPLLAGKPVWILPATVLSHPPSLVAALASHHRVALNCVPSLWAAILDQMTPGERAALDGRLTKLLLGGERLTADLVARTLGALPGVQIHNLYGPTEATANASAAIVTGAGEMSLGQPVAGARMVVLDSSLELPTLGSAGEIHIGGEGLSRGYLHRPDLTAERFVPDPYAQEPGARLYRTGDLARHREDGTLEFLGRVDLQVKIRGIRIEIEEVEAVLASHPLVRETAVAVWDDAAGERRLAAYVVVKEPAPALHELRDLLRLTLPDSMIPAVFLRLDALPRTPAGKVDRRALPEPGAVRGDETTAFSPPRTPVEEILAAIWCRIFGRERIGTRDSFFDLGGHSLTAARITSAVRETLGVELPFRTLFERPTVADLAVLVEEARRQRRSAPPPIRPGPRERDALLSFSQLRQWFLVQMDAETSAYNIPLVLRLSGRLEVRALWSALDGILHRHEVLRTTFSAVPGEPRQIVGSPWPVALPQVDLGGLPAMVRSCELDLRMKEQLRATFDLGCGPLWRAVLFRMAGEQHVLLTIFHHLVSDGWSLGVFTSELAALYEAISERRPSPLPPLPVQYADFALWQRRWLQGDLLEREVAYWRSRLAGVPPLLSLPTDRPRPVVWTYHGKSVELALPVGLGRALLEVGSRERVTLFMTLLAAFGALLNRYTAEDDLSLGTFVANRRWPEVEPLLGLFVNTLVLRCDLEGDPDLRTLLARVRAVALEAYEHQDLPFEKLLEELEPQRDPSRTPFFQAMLVLQNYPLSPHRLSHLSLEPQDLATGDARAHCDVTLWLWENGEDLEGYLEYNPDLFDRATCRRISSHLSNVLAALADGFASRVSELPLLSPAECHQILAEWGTTLEVRMPPLVHELIKLQAERKPDAVAVIGEEVALTYADLDRRADRLARRLQRLGVRTDTVVGLYCKRSPEAVVGILGILKAGGAYLPLDVGLPPERLSLLVQDSGLSILLADEELPADYPQSSAVVLPLPQGGDGPEGEEDGPIACAWSESGACLLYTSGSTGLPKGALISHRALATFVESARGLYELRQQDRVLQFCSLSSDITVEEIFPCLTTGAALLLRTQEMLASPALFLKTCAEWGITVIDLPTAYWHELADALGRGAALLPPSLRLVIIAGERALQERLRDWQGTVACRARLANTYGPMETTVAVTAYDPERPATGSSTNGIPIGRPIRGAAVHVLDQALRPVSIGVAGELYIGGAGLTRGYQGRPDRTAERFLPSPFAVQPGQRLYRSGDLVRWLADGNLEFLGRVDDQVKIRGFRVEPGEVAAVLCRHPKVREAAVIAHTGGGRELRLAGYAAVAPGATASELRAFLKARLPAYMVPADLVLLDALPLTANGKLDKRALPSPDTADDAGSYAPPETPVEEILARMWRELLGRERLGIHDDFFDAGGHSLLIPQMIAQMQDVFQVNLPLRVLFEAPTIAQLATIVEDHLLEQIEELSDEEAEALLAEGDR